MSEAYAPPQKTRSESLTYKRHPFAWGVFEHRTALRNAAKPLAVNFATTKAGDIVIILRGENGFETRWTEYGVTKRREGLIPQLWRMIRFGPPPMLQRDVATAIPFICHKISAIRDEAGRAGGLVITGKRA